ncbi:hypothetical protein INT45_004694 [Circinella minor]|uniref:Uncharacterized protein n=1 Tax=Circinella minor TaxID=1195481 RepID=A0A8H7SGE6_9FUNG|nr:hypothetical protein INT45_004694 [Circinella minor]
MEMFIIDLLIFNNEDRTLKNKKIFAQGIFSIFVLERRYTMALMKACARYMRLSSGTKVYFIPGEATLKAMNNTKKAATSKAPYLADAILRLVDLDDLEICVLEISNAYKEAGKAKVSFDHHKGMFAWLSMIRNVGY